MMLFVSILTLSHSLTSFFADLRIPLMWKDTEYFKNKGGNDLLCCVLYVLNLKHLFLFCLRAHMHTHTEN